MDPDRRSGVVDFGYLEQFAAGDWGVIREVLALFVQEAGRWGPQLADGAPGWSEVVHTIKGSSRGVGAFVLGDACQRAEGAATPDLAAVRQALADTVAAIEVYVRNRSQTSSS